MKKNTLSPLHVLLFGLVLVFQFSCSKDSDLLAEYVLSDTLDASEIGQFIIDDAFFIASSGSITLDVLANDTFESQEEVVITETSVPTSGSVEINSDNTLTYTPETTTETAVETVDTFTYTIEVVNEDTSVNTETGNVTVTFTEDANKISDELKAFPSAYGGGAIATGGRGRALCIINTLNRNTSLTYHAASGGDDEWYEGGLYAALQNPDVGYIVFNISGNIVLGTGGTHGDFSGTSGMPNVNNKTLFGQSAPKGGITLWGGSVRFSNVLGDYGNLIFRYFRSRPIRNRDGVVSTEDDSYTFGFMLYGGNDIIVDHMSASFAQDKAFGAAMRDNNSQPIEAGMTNITFQNCFAQDSHTGMYVEVNPGRAGDPQQYIDNISFINNVAVGLSRTPNMAFDNYGEILNNIIHRSPYKNTTTYHGLELNHIGNYYQSNGESDNRVMGHEALEPLIYSKENFYTGKLNGTSGESNNVIWNFNNGGGNLDNKYLTETKHTSTIAHQYTTTTAQEAFADLITNGNVGAYKYLNENGEVQIYRDSFDSSQLAIVRNNQSYTTKNISNWVLPAIPSNTRPGSYDTDYDGMSDAWELREFGNLDQSYRGDFDGDGYENIEEYMNQVDFN